MTPTTQLLTPQDRLEIVLNEWNKIKGPVNFGRCPRCGAHLRTVWTSPDRHSAVLKCSQFNHVKSGVSYLVDLDASEQTPHGRSNS